MADTVPNPFYGSSPLGEALKSLGKVIMTGPTDAERIIQAENALKLQRGRLGTDSLSNVFRQYGTPGFNPNEAVASSFQAGVDPARVASGSQFLAATKYGAASPQATDAAFGHTGNYGNTAAGEREKQALDLYKFNNTPVNITTPTGPVVSTREQAIGKPAVESLGNVQGSIARNAVNAPGGVAAQPPEVQRMIGADSKQHPKPLNYMTPDNRKFVTYDGKTDAQTGAPLPPGGSMAEITGTPEQAGLLRPNVTADLQKQEIAGQRFQALLSHTRTLAQADPKNFGIAGYIKGMAQDATQIAQNVSQGLGYNQVAEAVADVQRRAVANGVNPSLISGMFDPKLPALHTAGNLLIYSAAEALAGQSGRSVSDKDVQLFRSIAGDPHEWMGSQQKYLSKLDTMQQILGLNQQVVQQNLRPGGSAPVPQAPPGGGVAPPPSAPPGAPPMNPADPLGIR